MRKELQDKLYKKYPLIFKKRAMPPSQSALYFGIQCGDGWFDIIDLLCENIQQYAMLANVEITAVQVKSKFGLLRFYVDYHGTSSEDKSFIRGMIRMAESMSSVVEEKKAPVEEKKAPVEEKKAPVEESDMGPSSVSRR